MTERFDKWAAFYDACRRVNQFCVANHLVLPDIGQGDCQGHHGWYIDGTIRVDLKRCRVPSTSGYSWSWPGYTADLTPLGVVAHELGHHWHFSGRRRAIARQFLDHVAEEPAVTSYEPNTGESIAEAFKVFFTNPSLLLALRPKRYQFFLDKGLEPIEVRPWEEVLAGSPRHVLAVRRKLRRLA